MSQVSQKLIQWKKQDGIYEGRINNFRFFIFTKQDVKSLYILDGEKKRKYMFDSVTYKDVMIFAESFGASPYKNHGNIRY